MRTVLLVALLSLAVSSVSAQEILWSRTDSVTYAVGAIELDDGGVIVVASTDTPREGTTSGIELTRIDASGALVWSKVVGSYEKLNPVSACRLGDELVIFATGGALLQEWSSIYVGRFGLDGTTIRERLVDFKGRELFTALRQLPNGDLVASLTGGTGQLRSGLCRLTADGEFAWHRYYELLDDILSVDVRADGGVIATGYLQQEGRQDTDVFVLETDEAGELPDLRTTDSPLYEFSHVIRARTDGGIVIAGIVEGHDGIAFTWIDRDGRITTRTYPELDLRRIGAMEPDGDGFLVTGGAGEQTGSPDIVVARLDADGSLDWSTTAPAGGTNPFVASIVRTRDGGILLCATSTSDGGARSIVHRFAAEPRSSFRPGRVLPRFMDLR